MNQLVLYTFKVILCSGVLLGYYWFALRNKNFHQWNRFYLLACVLLSLTAPLLNINIKSHYTPPPANVLHLLNAVTINGDVEVESRSNTGFNMSTNQYLLLVYCLVSIVLLTVAVAGFVRIYNILRYYPKTKIDSIIFLNTDAKGTPFSFFRYIVWNNAIDLTTENGQRIFQHEMVHVQQRHTWDKIFLLFILIPFWCNPFFWLIRKELTVLHEFTADQKAAGGNDVAALANIILNTAFPQQQFLFANHLFQSPIKRRLAMLKKFQQSKASYWSRIIALPVLLFVIASFALKTKSVHQSTIAFARPVTVVIDAGHGGNEGARFENVYEDALVLAIAKRIKEQNANKNLHIVLTRENDGKVDLHKRVDFASENKADLFISIHANSVDITSNQQVKTPLNGMQVVVSAKNPPYQQQSEALGSVLVQELGTVYNTQKELIKPQTGVWVLDWNVCPAVLIECGYLTDQTDRKFMLQEANQSRIANKILDAIEHYEVLKKSSETSFSTDTLLQRMYNNKAVSDVQYFEYPKQEVHLIFADGTKDTISYADAKAANLFDSNAITQIEQRPWENEKAANKGAAAGNLSLTIRKATVAEARTFKGPLLLNTKIFKGRFAQMSVSENDIAYVSVIKGNAVKEFGLQPNDSALSITTKAFVKATTRTDGDPKNEPLFLQPEIEPKFPEANGGWRAFLKKNLNASVPVTHNAKVGSYTVIVGFIVDPNGKIYDIKPVTHRGYGMEDEVVRLMKLSPDWIPANQNGRNVSAYKKQTVTFVISEG